MKSITQGLSSLKFQSLPISHHHHHPHPLPPTTATATATATRQTFALSLKTRLNSLPHHQTHLPKTRPDDGIPADLVKTLAKFKSRHNFIRVLEVARSADHPFAGARLLLLDAPGNIHSISFLFKTLTQTYFDVFATLPPLLPPGPIAILGFGAGSAARSILELHPDSVVHGWELDPAVISVAREYFGLSRIEKQHPNRIYICIGNAFDAEIEGSYSGLLVDLFSKGCLVPELRDPATWEKMRRRLRRGGRIMVNVGGSCVEAEDGRDGREIMDETLRALNRVFRGEVSVLSLGNGMDDSSVALTGGLPDVEAWKKALPKPLRFYADMWRPFNG
ncbi:S-adenosyl-L-methionine-dependent methyltransferases superfamily protein [Actinidia rufa]|uniref:S-adenosyl-L-methionine-dependent methyltransferases superfamily protein n=1 Tax=Actinidia rufa TaxID=165716 RepID=A0A7J0H2S7_9ERIC|nr:S-adenosyl-L-methionine-dependent methyltransferases superfamily protein [Actinidia rufa]